MVADSAVAATVSVDGILNKISAFVATAQSAAAGGLTWAEFGELMLALLRLVVEQIDAVTTMTGEQKKALVLTAVGSLFDAVAGMAVPFFARPLWLIAKPAVRSLIIALASGGVEQILVLVRR